MSIDVAEWLKGLGLERYEPAFRENEIDWEALPKLTAEDLKDLGVGRPRKTGHVKELARQHTTEAIQSKLLWRSLGLSKPISPDRPPRRVSVDIERLVPRIKHMIHLHPARHRGVPRPHSIG